MSENEIETQDILLVRMFGGFSMTYNGRQILSGKKSGETQFSYLLQYMIHNRGTGVSRSDLEEVVFDGREIDDIHHAMQSVLYNARRKLQSSGLPDVNYFELKKGRYYWNETIRVQEDASEMERLCTEAEAEMHDMQRRMSLYLDACALYTGEFLGGQGGRLWAAVESNRYRRIFGTAVQAAADLLRENRSWQQMYDLGKHAAKMDPFSDWEQIPMESLIAMERYAEAQKLYSDTVDLYFREQGIRPDHRMAEMMESLGRIMRHPSAMIDDIQRELWEDVKGGYLCSYPIFRGIYNMMVRSAERSGQSVHLMLCTIVDGKGFPITEGDSLDELAWRLGDCICSSVRGTDVVNQFGKGQYLVLLLNTTMENCSVVEQRISEKFIVSRREAYVSYHVRPVIGH